MLWIEVTYHGMTDTRPAIYYARTREHGRQVSVRATDGTDYADAARKLARALGVTGPFWAAWASPRRKVFVWGGGAPAFTIEPHAQS